MKLSNQLSRRIGIDLGTSRTQIWHDAKGVLVDEASCLAVDERMGKVVAVGDEAASLSGRAPANIKVYWPIKNGVVVNPTTAQALLRTFLNRVISNSYFFRPVIMASVSTGADDIDRQVLTELLYGVGAREVFLIAQPLASAIGAEIPIADASGSFILHLGAGVVEGGIISFGSLVNFEYSLLAGQQADKLIQELIQQEKSLVISLKVAQKIKEDLGTCTSRELKKLVSGQDLVTTAPKEVEINAQLVAKALQPLAATYLEVMKKIMAKIPPELTADVIDKGVLLTGGMAQLHGLDSYLVQKLGVNVSVVDQPAATVIKGVAAALENLELFKESLGYSE